MRTTASPTPLVDPVAAAAAIRPVLGAQRPIGDARRLLTDETIAALTAAGQFRMLVPRRHGGLEATLATVLDATTQVAAADPGAGWVTMILGCADWLVGLLDERAQDEVYADGPDTAVCAVFNPSSTSTRVPGGWRVTGRWSPASGCRHAGWALLGVPLVDDPLTGGGVSRASVLMPMAELTLLDTWRTLGMRATASDTVVGTDVFVPEHRVLRIGPAMDGARRDRTPWRYRSAVMATLSVPMMAPYLGMATAALEHVVEAAGRRGITFTTYERQADSAAFQSAVATAALRIDAADALAHRAAAQVDGWARSGAHPTTAERARIRGWTAHVATHCREAVDLLVSAHGAAALAETSPLQGIVRDVHTASRHAVANPISGCEIYGRALLGVEPTISTLI